MGNPADVLWEGQGGTLRAQESQGALANSVRSSAARSHDGSLDGGGQRCAEADGSLRLGGSIVFSVTAPWTVSLGTL